MPRTSLRNTINSSSKRRLSVEQLESRTLFAQLAFGSPVSLGSGVNSSVHEEGISVTADGLDLMKFEYGNGAWLGIFEATRNSTTEPFGNAFSAGSDINSMAAPSHPDISADGLTLLFSDSLGGDLYQATRSQRNEPFTHVQGLGINNLLPGQVCESPFLSSDGKTLYFTAFNTARTENDIYQARRASTSDAWGNVIKLGSGINTIGYNDAQPSVSADGLRLFFNSSRPGGLGGFDLYVSMRSSVDAPWGNPVNLGPQVNTSYDEKGPSVSSDGSVLYFSSDRPGGMGGMDHYQVPILGEAGPTKFYVVDDGTTNRTFEYQSDGVAVDANSLDTGNTAPRGVASTAAGDKVWVVDANRRVYVYNTSGGLLGSWAAGTMTGAAQPEGITTNGTDVWIIDNKTDKVFRYASAARLLSGSQNAVSSFNLNSANNSPKDLVTDGTSIWVVNDSSTDKVFKYTLDGALLGSWTMMTSGALTPTGITLDPAEPKDLWIVDAGSRRVYQYDNAATRTGGSQSAPINFSLTAGNTNPQGIADPKSVALLPAERLTSDTDFDGDVDSADLLNLLAGWTGELSEPPGTIGQAEGDSDADGDVDSADLLDIIAQWTGAVASLARGERLAQASSLSWELPLSTAREPNDTDQDASLGNGKRSIESILDLDDLFLLE